MMHQLSIWQEQKNPMVRMHNHLVTANMGYLELSAMRIFLIMIAKLKWDDKELLPVRISLTDVLPCYSGGNNLDVIVKACDELKTKMRDVRILSIENGKKVYERMTVIDSVRYVEGTDYIEADFGKRIKPYLIDLKEHFTQTELRELMKLKSSHAIRFYLLVKSIYRSGEVYTIKVNDLRLMLLDQPKPKKIKKESKEQIDDPKSYSEYKDFKKYILNKAQATLSKTSAAFVFDEKRVGRSVDTLFIRPVNYPTPKVATLVISDGLAAQLEELKVNTLKPSKMLSEGEISEDYIRYVISAKQKDKKVKRIGGAIYDAVVHKQLWDEFLASKKKPVYSGVAKADEAYTYISMDNAQQMFKEENPKYPFPGFVKALKTGRHILVEGYTY
jgi:hypothetical protein